jgi:thiamine pyrophosphokinase
MPANHPHVIAADGGLDHAREFGIRPDVVIGDFDSVRGSLPTDAGIITLPAEKDDPDMFSALKVGWARGAREFHIYGGLGGRIDHTIANIQLLSLLSRHGAIGYLYGDGTVVCAVTDGELAFPAHECTPGNMVSVFSHSDVSTDVNEPGMKYQLRHARLTNSIVQGVSNEFLPDSDAAINVRHGTLIVTFPMRTSLPTVTLYHAFDGGLGELDTRVSAVLHTSAT